MQQKLPLILTEDEFVKQCIIDPAPIGKFVKYEEETQIRLLYRVFSEYGGRMQFEQIAGIEKQTFSDWYNKYPNFKRAYDKIKALSFTHWETLLLKEKDINFQYWRAIMRNRFNYGKPNFRQADGKKPLETIDSAIESLKDGEVTLKDVKDITEVLEKRTELESKLKIEVQQENLADKLNSEQRLLLKSWLDLGCGK